MTASFIVRVTRAPAPGRLAGHVEVVATGERAPIRSGDDLVAFLIARLEEGPAGTARPRQRMTEGSDSVDAPLLRLDEHRRSS